MKPIGVTDWVVALKYLRSIFKSDVRSNIYGISSWNSLLSTTEATIFDLQTTVENSLSSIAPINSKITKITSIVDTQEIAIALAQVSVAVIEFKIAALDIYLTTTAIMHI